MEAAPPCPAACLQLEGQAAVLEKLRSHTALEHQEALLALEQAQLHIGDLCRQNAELEQRAAVAAQAAESVRASATQEWGGMKDDISRLVLAAEQAQVEAQGVVRRARAEAEDKLSRLQGQLEAAQQAQAAAQAQAEEGQQQLGSLQTELERARRTASQAASEQEATCSSREAAREQVRQLEEQVDQLQKQLVAARKGISTAAAKKAAAANGLAARMKKENERLKAQAEGLQEEVRSLWAAAAAAG